MKKQRTPRTTGRRKYRGVTGGAVYRRALPFAQHAFEGRIEFMNGAGIPTIFVAPEAYSRMWHFVDIAIGEVSWLGTVALLSHGDYLIEEVFLLKQVVSTGHTELSAEGQAELAQDLLTSRPHGEESVNRLRFWGHSHVNMGTTPSYQDTEQVEQFRENGCPWFIRGILNKKGRIEFTLFLWEAGIVIRDVPWSVYHAVDESMRDGLEAEFKEKVAQEIIVYTALPGTGYVFPPAWNPNGANNLHQIATAGVLGEEYDEKGDPYVG